MQVSIDPMVAWGGRSTRRILGALVMGVTAVAVMASVPTTATAWNQGGAEATLWQLLNGARVNNGLAPLQQHSGLVGLARWRSQDMVDRGYFSHTIPGGCDVYCYYDSNGIAYQYGGENIGWNSGWSDAQSPVKVHEGFMASPGHRANVLDGSFTHGGVGAYGRDGESLLNGSPITNLRMYTELFLQAPAAAPAPPPPAPAPAAPAPAPAAPAPAPAAPAPAPAAPAPAPAAPAPEAPAPAAPAAAPEATEAPAAEEEEEAADEKAQARSIARKGLEIPARLAAIQTDALIDGGVIEGMDESAGSMTADAGTDADAEAGQRVESAPPAEAGFFESMLRSVLGFLFGG